MGPLRGVKLWWVALSVFLLSCPSSSPESSSRKSSTSSSQTETSPPFAGPVPQAPPALPVEARPAGRLFHVPREIHFRWSRPTPARTGPVPSDRLSRCFRIKPDLPIQGVWTREDHFKANLVEVPAPRTAYTYRLTCLPDADTVYGLPKPIEQRFITPGLEDMSVVVDRVNPREIWIRLAPVYPMDTAMQTLRQILRLVSPEGDHPPETVVVRSPSELLAKFPRPSREEVVLWVRKGWRTLEAPFHLRKPLKIPIQIPERNVTLARVEGTWRGGQPGILITCTITHEPRCLLDPDYVLKTVKILPRVGNLRAESIPGGGVLLRGDFEPGRLYVLTFPKGFSVEDAALPHAVERTVQIPEAPIRVRFPVQGMIFPPGLHEGQIPVQATGGHRLRIQVRWIPPQNLALWARGRKSWWEPERWVSEVIRDTVVDIAGTAKGVLWLPLEKLGVTDAGVYLLEATLQVPPHRRLSWEERRWAHARTTVLVSPILLYARIGENEVGVWALESSGLHPVPGVRVEVRSGAGVLQGTCTTDADGFCRTAISRFKPALILATKEGHVTFLDLLAESMGEGTREPGGSPIRPFRVALLPERDLYRPGETLHVALTARVWGSWKAAPLSLRVRLLNPRGQVFRERTVAMSPAGWGEVALDLPTTMATGTYTLQARYGDEIMDQTRIFVEVFRPSRMHLDLEVSPYLAGTRIPVRLQARYLFGRPADGLGYTLRCRVQNLPDFRIPGHPRYRIATGVERREEAFREVSGTLDQEGKAETGCTIPVLGPLMRAQVQVEVTDPTGESTTETRTVILFQHPTALGIYVPVQYVSEHPVPVSIRLWSPEGQPQDRPVTLALLRRWREWEYVNFRWVERTWVETLQVVTLQTREGTASWTWTPPKEQWFWGRYEIWVTASRTVPTRAVVYPGWWWDREVAYLQPEQLPVHVPEGVDEGAPIPVLFASAFPGKALVTLETQTILAHRWVDVQPGTTRVDLPGITEDPTGYVSVFLFHPSSMGIRRHYGVARIQVIPSRIVASVELRMPDTLRPGQTATLELRTDEPVEGAVALVDEGILMLTDFEPPDVVRRVLRPFPPRFRGADNLYALMRVFLPGGGAGGETRLPVVQSQKLFSRWYTFRGRGRIRIPLNVPSFYTGEARLAVHVVSPNRMRTLVRRVPIRAPLSWNVMAPDYLYPGDRSRVAVRIWNETGRRQSLTVKFTGPGVRRTLRLALPPDGDTLLQLAIQAPDAVGKAVYVVEARGKGILQETLRIRVFPKATYVSEGTLLLLEQGVHDLTPYIQGYERALHRIRVFVSPHPLAGGLQHLAYLVQYPYGCLEQTTSSLVPLVAFYDLLPALDTIFSPVAIKTRAEAGIARYMSFQRYDGSFSFWPGGREEAPPELQFYALFVLQEAREAGFGVPEGLMERAARRLLGYVDRTPFGAFVLAREGVLRSTYAGDLLRILQDPARSPRERLWAAAALYALGNRKLALEHFATLPPPPWPKAGARVFYGSPLRDLGMYLWVQEYLRPGGPAHAEGFLDLATRLSRHPSWRYNTQELGWALMALALRLRHLPPPRRMDVVVRADGKAIPLKPTGKGMPVADFPEPPKKLSIQVNEGPVYVLVENHGFPKAPRRERTEPYAVQVTLRSPGGQPVNQLETGEWYLLEVQLHLPEDAPDAVVDVKLPAGLRSDNPRLLSLLLPTLEYPSGVHLFRPDYLDIRGHTVRAYGHLPKGKILFRIPVQALIPGSYFFPSAAVLRMYVPTRRGTSREQRVAIR